MRVVDMILFNYTPSDWEDSSLYPDIALWIQGVSTVSSDDIHYFQCEICKTGKISLSNMGIGAVKSHMKDPSPDKLCKHNKKIKELRGVRKYCFVTSTVSSNGNSFSDIAQQSLPSSSAEANVAPMSKTSQSSTSVVQSVIKTKSKEVVKSEILWAFYVVYKHHCLSSSGGMSELFQVMFSDGSIAKDFSVSSAKLSYIINHGLAPFFKAEIMHELAPKTPRLAPKFVTCFDESFNQVCFSKQMDIHVIYFDDVTKRVNRVY